MPKTKATHTAAGNTNTQFTCRVRMCLVLAGLCCLLLLVSAACWCLLLVSAAGVCREACGCWCVLPDAACCRRCALLVCVCCGCC
jgi:hypothetical protein